LTHGILEQRPAGAGCCGRLFRRCDLFDCSGKQDFPLTSPFNPLRKDMLHRNKLIITCTTSALAVGTATTTR
jgi:hypothetical protein